jgi:hypothetical protein
LTGRPGAFHSGASQPDPLGALEGETGLGALLEEPIEAREGDPVAPAFEFFQELSPSDRARGPFQNRDHRIEDSGWDPRDRRTGRGGRRAVAHVRSDECSGR